MRHYHCMSQQVWAAQALESFDAVVQATEGFRSRPGQRLTVAVADGYRYSDDSPSVLANHGEFREHRHDQSISSLLRKLRGTEITHYEVQLYDRYFTVLQPKLPAWATRRRT